MVSHFRCTFAKIMVFRTARRMRAVRKNLSYFLPNTASASRAARTPEA